MTDTMMTEALKAARGRIDAALSRNAYSGAPGPQFVRRMAEQAAALLIAEIERLDRAEEREGADA